ncbi:RNA-binding protein 5 [Dissostichus eleginoides]|uniref:RNA-binding protein 5 n=1 Tax=Dissostichus eleginoides TaxID=100907 RepID=A0AAD9BSD1_DISEL|nr:RNA-binding protein 5 [Dissostichus eleginoides]
MRLARLQPSVVIQGGTNPRPCLQELGCASCPTLSQEESLDSFSVGCDHRDAPLCRPPGLCHLLTHLTLFFPHEVGVKAEVGHGKWRKELKKQECYPRHPSKFKRVTIRLGK